MGIIESALAPIEGYLWTIKRNTQEGWYELEIGIPNSWVFNSNNEIDCEVITETETGKIIRIFPKNNGLDVDDLNLFVQVIIDINQKIAAKEKEFADKMEEMKKTLEKQASEFYKELDDLKDTSFKKLTSNYSGEKKETRGRKPKVAIDTTETAQ
jgi:hypothetical protein